MANKLNEFTCRVCGKIQDNPPWGENGQCPTYDICDCCGVEFGYGDCTLKAIRTFREQWLANGSHWKYPKEKPTNWSLEDQLKQISKDYK